MAVANLIPERSAGDILAGRTVLWFGGKYYEVPALTIDESERWLAQIDAEVGGLLSGLSAAGDDLPVILELLTGAPDKLLDLLYAYDIHAALPVREELRSIATKAELLAAVLGVWQTENPLVALAMAGMASGLVASASSEPMSSPPPPTAGARKRSARH